MENEPVPLQQLLPAATADPPKCRHGVCRIDVLKVPRLRYLPNLARSHSTIPLGLRMVFAGLLQGKLRWPLYLYGPTGSGKTCAALCLCDLVPSSTYATVDELSGQAFDRDHGLWACARTVRLFVLDEVGASRVGISLYEQIAVKRLADLREQEADRVAIYLSNLDPEELRKAYGEAVKSRMLCGEVVELDRRDLRRA